MQVYVPMKDDAIDKKLAEFLNNFPDRSRLKVMFLRQSEGVYTFGTKKVFVKVEMEKIVSKLLFKLSPCGRRLSHNRRVHRYLYSTRARPTGAPRPTQTTQRESSSFKMSGRTTG